MIGLIVVFIAHNLLLFFLWQNLERTHDSIIKRSDYHLLLFIFLLLSLLGLQMGDYNAYGELVSDAYSTLKAFPATEGDVTHMGRMYDLLAYWMGGHYLLWRLVVFGGSFVIILNAVKRIGFNTWLFFFLFTLISMSGFFVGRMFWGVAWFFCSVIVAKKTGNPWLLLLSLLSVFSHKCLYILPVFLPFYFLKLNKRSLVYLGLFFVAVFFALKFAFEDLKLFDLYVEGMSRSISAYTEENVTSTSVFGRSIGEIIVYLSQFIAVFVVLLSVLFRSAFNRIVLPDYIQTMVLITVGLLLFALAMVIGEYGDGTLSFRYISISYFPMTFVVYYVKKNKLISKLLYSLFLIIALMSFEASLLVSIYYQSVG